MQWGTPDVDPEDLDPYGWVRAWERGHGPADDQLPPSEAFAAYRLIRARRAARRARLYGWAARLLMVAVLVAAVWFAVLDLTS